MFEWFPFTLGKYMTYHQYFAAVACIVLSIVALLNIFIMLICERLIHILPNKNNKNQKKIDTETELTSVNNSYQQLSEETQKKKQRIITQTPPSSIKNTLQIIAEVCWTVAWIAISACPLVCGALTIIPTWTSILCMFGCYLLKWIIQVIQKNWLLKQQNQEQKQVLSEEQKRRIKVSKYSGVFQYLFLVVPWCLLMPLFMNNTCLCFYNSEIGYYNKGLGWNINTQFTRQFQLDPACPEGKPCHIYATVPEDVSHAVFINVQTSKKTRALTVKYDTEEMFLSTKSPRFSEEATLYDIQGIESLGERNVHTALLKNLTADTRYVIQIFYNDAVQAQKIYKTVTDDIKNLTMLNGGDSGTTEPAKNFNKLIGATMKPDIFFVGGDIAYDDNFNSCYYTWDFYFSELEAVFDKVGYIFPTVFTVGNHDVGLNELPGINITQNLAGPPFLSFFPQHYARDDNFQIVEKIPEIGQRSTVFYHKFGNVLYLSLDSGYLQLFGGWQEKLIVQWFSENPKTLKFVNYHVPIYSACDRPDKNPSAIVNALFHWVPWFDRFRVMTSFENHVHAFKRTYPLVGNMRAYNGNGTVYLGDGCYGAIPTGSKKCKLNTELDIYEKVSHDNNFWVSYISPQKVIHVAYGNTGAPIDYTEMDTSYYLFDY